jgi:hypothetical protein
MAVLAVMADCHLRAGLSSLTVRLRDRIAVLPSTSAAGPIVRRNSMRTL